MLKMYVVMYFFNLQYGVINVHAFFLSLQLRKYTSNKKYALIFVDLFYKAKSFLKCGNPCDRLNMYGTLCHSLWENDLSLCTFRLFVLNLINSITCSLEDGICTFRCCADLACFLC